MDSPSQCIAQWKKRKANWSNDETLRLVDAIAEEELIVNGRYTIFLTNDDKHRAWQAVTDAVNASNIGVRRTEEEVRNKWFSLVSHYRKKVAAVQSGNFFFYLYFSANEVYD